MSLSKQELAELGRNVGPHRTIVGGAIGQLFLSSPSKDILAGKHSPIVNQFPDILQCKDGWVYTRVAGAVVFVVDRDMDTCLIQIYDVVGHVLRFQFETYLNLEYLELEPTFHAFELDDCVAGINFANGEEAKRFYYKVIGLLPRSKHGAKVKSECLKPSPGMAPAPKQTSRSMRTRKTREPSERKGSSRTLSSFFTKRSSNKSHKSKNMEQQTPQKPTKSQPSFKASTVPIRAAPASNHEEPRQISHVTSIVRNIHVGVNQDGSLDFTNISPEWRTLFQQAGLTSQDLADPKMKARIREAVKCAGLETRKRTVSQTYSKVLHENAKYPSRGPTTSQEFVAEQIRLQQQREQIFFMNPRSDVCDASIKSLSKESENDLEPIELHMNPMVVNRKKTDTKLPIRSQSPNSNRTTHSDSRRRPTKNRSNHSSDITEGKSSHEMKDVSPFSGPKQWQDELGSIPPPPPPPDELPSTPLEQPPPPPPHVAEQAFQGREIDSQSNPPLRPPRPLLKKTNESFQNNTEGKVSTTQQPVKTGYPKPPVPHPKPTPISTVKPPPPLRQNTIMRKFNNETEQKEAGQDISIKPSFSERGGVSSRSIDDKPQPAFLQDIALGQVKLRKSKPPPPKTQTAKFRPAFLSEIEAGIVRLRHNSEVESLPDLDGKNQNAQDSLLDMLKSCVLERRKQITQEEQHAGVDDASDDDWH